MGRVNQARANIEFPADAQVLANAMQPTEEEALERGFLSWRSRTLRGSYFWPVQSSFSVLESLPGEHQGGEEYPKPYLVLTAQVSISCNAIRILHAFCYSHYYSVSFEVLNAFGPTTILHSTCQHNSYDMGLCTRYGHTLVNG